MRRDDDSTWLSTSGRKAAASCSDRWIGGELRAPRGAPFRERAHARRQLAALAMGGIDEGIERVFRSLTESS